MSKRVADLEIIQTRPAGEGLPCELGRGKNRDHRRDTAVCCTEEEMDKKQAGLPDRERGGAGGDVRTVLAARVLSAV